jgi:Putative MetA-pathway of phenol degradation
MMDFRKVPGAICAAVVVMVAGATPCRAVDYQPFDWVPAPRGTSILMGYYQFATHGDLTNTITGAVGNSHLDSHIGIARYLYYNEAFGVPFVLDLILPFGALTDGKIGGNPIGSSSGIADPAVSVGAWLVNQPAHGRYLSAASFLFIPIGAYDSQSAVNLGQNRWQHDLQVDFTQTLFETFTIDVAGVWTYYGENTAAGPTRATLSQDSSWSAYAWLTYDVTPAVRRAMPTAGPSSLSAGYAGTFGGAVKIDGIPNGSKTEEHQIRFSYSQFVVPTWQVLLSLSRDVSATGQFKQDFGLLLRIAKVL